MDFNLFGIYSDSVVEMSPDITDPNYKLVSITNFFMWVIPISFKMVIMLLYPFLLPKRQCSGISRGRMTRRLQHMYQKCWP